MASYGKVLDLLDDRYLQLQDIVGNVEPFPTLVPYEDYTQNVHVYRMDTNHEIFLGLIQDFTMRRGEETRKELWTWWVQWEVDKDLSTQHLPLPKKVRLYFNQASTLVTVPRTPRQAPALTIFERRTLDGALMLGDEMLRILIDIVQVASALVPNFIEFLYRWIDYYEGDGKALKAALRWEIPSLWDFEYHPLLLPPGAGKESNIGNPAGTQSGSAQQRRSARSVSRSNEAELRQSSPTKKMQTRPKPDLAAIESQTLYTEESERLQYREVKYGIQPPKLEEPLPPLINIPRDHRKRMKYYAACFKSRQRALYLLLEAGVTVRQINNYQKLQNTHPKETLETGDGNGLRNYQKDAKFAQAQFELKEKQIKQHEISISNKLAAEAEFAASYAVSDGAAGLPLIPPTPSYARRPDMAAAMMERIKAGRANPDQKITVVPDPLVGKLKSKLFEGAEKKPPPAPLQDFLSPWYVSKSFRAPSMFPTAEVDQPNRVEENGNDEDENGDDDEDDDDGDEDEYAEDEESEDADMRYGSSSDEESNRDSTMVADVSVPAPNLPRPLPTFPLATQPVTARSRNDPSDVTSTQQQSNNSAIGIFDHSAPFSIATYMRNLNTEQAQRLISLLGHEARQAMTSQPEESHQRTDSIEKLQIPTGSNRPATTNTQLPAPASIGFDMAHFMYLRRQQESTAAAATLTTPEASPCTTATSQLRQDEVSSEDRQSSTEPPPILLQPISTSAGPQSRPSPTIQPVLAPSGTHQVLSIISTTPPTCPPPSNAMLPPPRPGISRNAPSPISLSPLKPSPFTTFAEQILTTSPFLNSSQKTKKPVQIFVPSVLIPGNGIGPDGSRMGNNNCVETDALLLGYETESSSLVLSKALFLPVGVWENTLKKVRTGRWSVLETYACPPSHPAKSKGKGRSEDEKQPLGSHRAVYEKLAHAYSMMTVSSREELLTKRWRASRGPVTTHDRGAVWEGWAVYVDREIEMSAKERRDAVGRDDNRIPVEAYDDGGVGDEYPPYDSGYDLSQREREMQELMDEDEDMED